MRKGILAALLAGSLAAAALTPMSAYADGQKVVTLGVDLTDEQRTAVLKYFGVYGQNIQTLYINNQDERDHLASYVPLEQIGTHTYSCALVSPTTSGGIRVKTANLSWVTSNMIASTLSTSGVQNCEVLAASPFEVSGTGALTGIIMAYESASGTALNAEKKDIATQELVTTGQISNQIGQAQATSLVNDIKMQIIENNVQYGPDVVNVVNNVIDQHVEATSYLTPEDRQMLYDLADRFAEEDYDYEEMRETLERVENNITQMNAAMDAMSDDLNNAAEVIAALQEDDSEEEKLSDDSILMNTDDSALGDNVIMSSTDEEALSEDEVARQVASETASAAEPAPEPAPAQSAPEAEPAPGEIVIPEATDEITIPEATDEVTIPEATDPAAGVPEAEPVPEAEAAPEPAPETPADQFVPDDQTFEGEDGTWNPDEQVAEGEDGTWNPDEQVAEGEDGASTPDDQSFEGEDGTWNPDEQDYTGEDNAEGYAEAGEDNAEGYAEADEGSDEAEDAGEDAEAEDAGEDAEAEEAAAFSIGASELSVADAEQNDGAGARILELLVDAADVVPAGSISITDQNGSKLSVADTKAVTLEDYEASGYGWTEGTRIYILLDEALEANSSYDITLTGTFAQAEDEEAAESAPKSEVTASTSVSTLNCGAELKIDSFDDLSSGQTAEIGLITDDTVASAQVSIGDGSVASADAEYVDVSAGETSFGVSLNGEGQTDVNITYYDIDGNVVYTFALHLTVMD